MKFSRIRRDRHERGARGPLIPRTLPRYRTRRDIFDGYVLAGVERMAQNCQEVRDIEFAVEDVPPSDPAPWESNSVILGRGFGEDRPRRLPARVVVYRRPCEQRAREREELAELVRAVLVEQTSQLLSLPPESLDPGWMGF